MKDFKTYLIEKILGREYKQIERDQNFNVGIEYECILMPGSLSGYVNDIDSDEVYLNFRDYVEEVNRDYYIEENEWRDNIRRDYEKELVKWESALERHNNDLKNEKEKPKEDQDEDLIIDITDNIDQTEQIVEKIEELIKYIKLHQYVDSELTYSLYYDFDVGDDPDPTFEYSGVDAYDFPSEVYDFWSDQTGLSETEIDSIVRQGIWMLCIGEYSTSLDVIESMGENGLYFDFSYGQPDVSDNMEEIFADNFDFKYADSAVYGGYHSNQSVTNKWRIETDTSIEPENVDEFGAEIISPVQPLAQAIDDLKYMCDFISDNGYTNSSCGMHVNISYTGKRTQDLDVFKMIAFAEEELIYKFFEDRRNNGYAKQMLHNVITRNTGNKKVVLKDPETRKVEARFKSEFADIIAILMPEAQKYSGINFSNDNRIEFRYLGGDRYENEYERLKQFILRFCYLYKLGMDPSFKRNEYITKITRMIEKVNPSPEDTIGQRVKNYKKTHGFLKGAEYINKNEKYNQEFYKKDGKFYEYNTETGVIRQMTGVARMAGIVR